MQELRCYFIFFSFAASAGAKITGQSSTLISGSVEPNSQGTNTGIVTGAIGD